ncbi:MAG TPA: hypothetical protein VGM73_04840 [Candidatus Didemnitutus sp.]|jgi:hypothetical protein
MKTRIIALYGPANVGKTTTLKIVLVSLEKRRGAVSTRFIDLTDIRAIISIGKLKIGIESQGDPASRLPESLNLFIREGCHIIICATRTRGATVDAVKAHAAREDITWIQKISSATENERSRLDAACASEILAKIP